MACRLLSDAYSIQNMFPLVDILYISNNKIQWVKAKDNLESKMPIIVKCLTE